jgi:hypothetical protein
VALLDTTRPAAAPRWCARLAAVAVINGAWRAAACDSVVLGDDGLGSLN